MKIPLHPSELLRLVTQLNFEIQEHIVDTIASSHGPICIAGWNKVGGEVHLEIRGETKMAEVRSVVFPVSIVDANILSIPLDGAQLEVVGATRVDKDHRWSRDRHFGDQGSLKLALPSFDPEHVQAAAVVLAQAIDEYLDTVLETY